jgi:hypothetical protein
VDSLSVPLADGFPHELSDNQTKLDFAGFVDGELFDADMPPEAAGRPERKPYLLEVFGFKLTFDLPDQRGVPDRGIIEIGVILGMLNR